MIKLHEQYRPTTFDDVVGQDKAIARFRAVARRGIGGRAFWISGKSGTGKTTIARLIAREIASELNILESNARDLSVSDVRDLERAMHTYGMGKRTGRAWIFNESHRMRSDVVTRLLTTLEELPDHVLVVFTTTVEGSTQFEEGFDAKPFLSRCVQLPLAQQGLAKALAARARDITIKEGLITPGADTNGTLLARCVKLVNKNGGNFRGVLTEIESGALMD